MPDDSKKDKATKEFNKLQKAEDGRKAMSDYEAEQAAVRAKTARLRALRLARDAAAPPPPPKPVRGTKKASAKPASRKAASLSAWLDSEKDSGRRS